MSWYRKFAGFPKEVVTQIRENVHKEIEGHYSTELHEAISDAEKNILKAVHGMNPNLHVEFLSTGHLEETGGDLKIEINATVPAAQTQETTVGATDSNPALDPTEPKASGSVQGQGSPNVSPSPEPPSTPAH